MPGASRQSLHQQIAKGTRRAGVPTERSKRLEFLEGAPLRLWQNKKNKTLTKRHFRVPAYVGIFNWLDLFADSINMGHFPLPLLKVFHLSTGNICSRMGMPQKNRIRTCWPCLGPLGSWSFSGKPIIRERADSQTRDQKALQC